jgi:hypothetical protein
METLVESFRNLPHEPTQERRKHPRNDCFIEAYCMVQGCGYKGSIQNVSEGGAYISMRGEKFFPGDEIFLVARIRLLRDQLRGRIIWVGSNGMGVEFQMPELDCAEPEAEQEDGGASEKERRKMGRITPKRVRWEPSTSAEVSYRLYWSLRGAIGYDSDYADVGTVTQVTVPDDIPSFPLESGKIELGISAVNQARNESEITKATVHLDFTVPEAPTNLRVEEL